MKNVSKNFLSVVVPAYKQEKTILEDLRSIDNALKNGLPPNFKYEIICVVDGNLDNTVKEAKKTNSKNIKVITYEINQGKGYAVRMGMKNAKGDLISFLDAGMDISSKGIMMLLSHMDWYNADIIVGSKRHPVSRVNYPLKRKLLSTGYHFLIRMMFNLNIKDTQSGIKIFKRNVVEKILPRLLVKRYAMDIEMLAVAKYLGFSRIYEAPIEVQFNAYTSAVKWKTIFEMLKDTLAVFYRLRIIKFYDNNYKKSKYIPKI